MKQEIVGFWDGSGNGWTIYTAPRSNKITTATPHHSIFTGWILFLMPNQQCQSTEGKAKEHYRTLIEGDIMLVKCSPWHAGLIAGSA